MPPDTKALRGLIAARQYLFSAHASMRAAERGIRSEDVEAALVSGEVIEDYPDDKYGPSCLIMGKSNSGRTLHIQLSYPPQVKIITLYEPSPDQWEDDFRTRRTQS